MVMDLAGLKKSVDLPVNFMSTFNREMPPSYLNLTYFKQHRFFSIKSSCL